MEGQRWGPKQGPWGTGQGDRKGKQKWGRPTERPQLIRAPCRGSFADRARKSAVWLTAVFSRNAMLESLTSGM